MALPSWVSRYVGIPFVPHGRSMKGCDCYGLVRIVLEDQYSILLPSLDVDYEYGNRQSESALIDAQLCSLDPEKVDSPLPGDLVILRYMGVTSHIALFLGEGRVLHTMPKVGACVEKLDSALLKSRGMGYYRIRETS